MYIPSDSLDDLMLKVFKVLLRRKSRISPSRGPATELTSVLLGISTPRARLSRTEGRSLFFGCLGELLWYLSGSDSPKFITYYVPKYRDEVEDGKIYGAYGPRLLNMRGTNQLDNVISLLRTRPDSRRAVIQLFDAGDIGGNHKEIPCTCTLQFMVRDDKLHMLTTMRSNDAFVGLPHDVFAFTMLQELIARTLNVELGSYRHAVGSLHLYDTNRDRAAQLLDEGWQEQILMPPMPIRDPWESVKKLLSAEKSIRNRGCYDRQKLRFDNYWGDIVRLLEIYWHSEHGNELEIRKLKGRMDSRVYDVYIEKRKRTAARRAGDGVPIQPQLFS